MKLTINNRDIEILYWLHARNIFNNVSPENTYFVSNYKLHAVFGQGKIEKYLPNVPVGVPSM